jgi:hypothetical protein
MTARTLTANVPASQTAIPRLAGLRRNGRMSSARSATASAIQTGAGTDVAIGSSATGNHNRIARSRARIDPSTPTSLRGNFPALVAGIVAWLMVFVVMILLQMNVYLLDEV